MIDVSRGSLSSFFGLLPGRAVIGFIGSDSDGFFSTKGLLF